MTFQPKANEEFGPIVLGESDDGEEEDGEKVDGDSDVGERVLGVLWHSMMNICYPFATQPIFANTFPSP